MSTVNITADEAFENLTGFDQLAIKQHFGATVTDLADQDALMLARALVFCHMVHGGEAGMSEALAKDRAMEMRLGDVDAYFADDEPEGLGVPSESGKGEWHDS